MEESGVMRRKKTDWQFCSLLHQTVPNPGIKKQVAAQALLSSSYFADLLFSPSVFTTNPLLFGRFYH